MGGIALWSLLLFMFLFPNGEFAPRWMRWVVSLMSLTTAVQLYLVISDNLASLVVIWIVLILAGVGIGSQVYRYRKVSNPTQRQQTKWVMFALVIVFIAIVIANIPVEGTGTSAIALTLVKDNNFIYALFPLSIAFAILRYRLWDIDLIIRRTLQYGLLSVLLGLLYFGMVTLLQTAFVGFSQQQSPLVLVLSTLAIAALFNPLRRRIQQVIDRRFFRRSYNTERILEGFADMTRSETDMNALTVKLVEITMETIQPESISLWVRSGAKTGQRSRLERNKPV